MEMLAAGKSAVREVPRERWNAAAYYDADYRTPGKTNSRWGGFLSEIDRFDAAFFNILPLKRSGWTRSSASSLRRHGARLRMRAIPTAH